MEQERVYSPNQAAIGAFVGGPLVSVLFIKRNFKALGNSSGERKTLLYGVIVILLFLCILPTLPKSLPNMLIPLITIVVTRSIVEYQIKKQDVAVANVPLFQSNWRVFWVSLGCMVLSLLVGGAVLFGIDTIGKTLANVRQPPSAAIKQSHVAVAVQSPLAVITQRSSEVSGVITPSSNLTRLGAEIDQETEKAHHGGPYPLFTTGRGGEFAAYVNECLDKIVAYDIDNGHAQEHVVSGSKIIFSMTILPDGRLKAVTVLNNDGGPALDRLLRGAIQRAAPFPRFPQAMAEKHDKLVVTRTFVFEAGRSADRKDSVREE